METTGLTRKVLAHPAPFITVGLALGFIVPAPSQHLSAYVMTPLIVVMYLSTTEIRFKCLLDVGSYLRKVAIGLSLNYILIGAVTLLLAWAAFGEGDIYAGFVMIAAMPTAIAVIPLSHLLRGNERVALVGTTMTYIMALVVAPTMVLLCLGSSVDVWGILETLVIVIVVPLLCSRLLLALDIDRKFGVAKDVMINICFLIVIYTIIGVNRDAFFIEPGLLLVIIGIGVARTFGTGFGCLAICKATGVERGDAVIYTLLSSFKNLGLTAVVALVLLGERASIPAAVGMPIELLNFIVLSVAFGAVYPLPRGMREETRVEARARRERECADRKLD